MTSVKLMLNKCRMLNDGNFPLVFQIIHSRQKRLINTGYKLKEDEFDTSLNKVKMCADSSFSESEVVMMNRKLTRQQKKIDNCIKKITSQSDGFSVTDLLDFIKYGSSSEQSNSMLLQYVRLQIAKKQEIGKDGTAAAYHSTLASLVKYIATFCPRRTDIRLSEIDSHFVDSYERFLYHQGMVDNTISYYLRNFRTFYNRAVRDIQGLKDLNPFKYVHTRPCRTIKRALTKQNIQDIACCSFNERPSVEFSRDLYLFSFYAQGMSFVDIVFLKHENIQAGVLSYQRHKSKQLIHVLVTSQLQRLIDKYSSGSGFIFPIIDPTSSVPHYKQYRLGLARINRHLSYIAARLSIDVPLTTYTARHTWATLAHYCGAPVSVISAGLGHTSEEITRIYLKEFDVNVLAEVNRNVSKLIQSK